MMRETKMLRDEVTNALLQPIDKDRVMKDGKGFSHLAAWDVRRTMNTIFGFGRWSAEVLVMELISEREVTQRNGKQGFNVIYRAQCKLSIEGEYGEMAIYTEWAAGDATNPTLAEAHDQAIKTAESQAFKRCCVNLGDQFGLSLYRNGSTDASIDEIVGQKHGDSDQVPMIVEAFNECETEADLGIVAEQVPGLDLSKAEVALLREAYNAARARITPSDEG